MTQLWFLTVHSPFRLIAHRNISTLHQNSAFFQRLMMPTAGFGVTSNRFGIHRECTVLNSPLLVHVICGSSVAFFVPTRHPLEATLQSWHDALSVHRPAQSRRLVRVVSFYRYFAVWFEFKFKFSNPSTLSHLWLGSTKIAPRHQQTHLVYLPCSIKSNHSPFLSCSVHPGVLSH